MEKGTITTNNYKAFDKLYSGTQNAMWKLAEMAFDLSVDDVDGFRKHCMNELHMSKFTVSKLITSGEIISEMNRTGLLTSNYSVVYELNPVKEQMDAYVEELANTQYKPFSEMTVREVRESVKTFFNDEETEDETDTEVEDDTEDEDVTEETTVADSHLKEDLENILVRIESMSVYKVSLKNDIIADLTEIIRGL